MMRSVVFLFILILSPISLLYAEESTQNESLARAIGLFDAWAEGTIAYDRIPGVAVGFVSNQELIWSKGYGFADLQRKTPVTKNTLYGICSISKLFTSIAVMQQRDAGKLSLEDPVIRYLDYANLKSGDPESPPATVRSLLTHSSGLPRESNHPYWTDPEYPFPTKEAIIEGLHSQRMLYTSERYFQYSNLGLTFAGEVVEKVSSQTFEDYVKKNILDPLGLKSTTPYMPEEQQGKGLATGYSAINREGIREPQPFYQTRGIAPAAGLASNVQDLAAFASWQFRLLEKGGEEVLKASTLREMQRVHWVDPDWKTTWGLGFHVYQSEDQTLVGHTGACPGYYTALLMNPRKKIAAIVMMNAMNVPSSFIAGQMLKIIGPAAEKKKDSLKEEKNAPKADMEPFSGRYWSAWGETVVVPWEDGLAALDFPSRDPLKDLTKLKYIEGNRFRRIRMDSDEPGEEVLFEKDQSGKVTRLLWHQNYSRKIQ